MSNRRRSTKKSNSRSSSESSNSSNFDEQYRDASPISTTTSDSSDDDNGTACGTTPTTPTTPTKCSFKPDKELSPVSQIPSPLIISPHFPLPSLPSVAVYQSTPQRQAPSAPPEPSAPDNILEDFNHFRRMKKRAYWTPLELQALENGMKEFGTQWARILRMYGGDHGPLRNRNAVQLKDKARNEKLRRIKSRLDLGVFYMATGGEDITEDELVDD